MKNRNFHGVKLVFIFQVPYFLIYRSYSKAITLTLYRLFKTKYKQLVMENVGRFKINIIIQLIRQEMEIFLKFLQRKNLKSA